MPHSALASQKRRALILPAFEHFIISTRRFRIGDGGLFTRALSKTLPRQIKARTVKMLAQIAEVVERRRYGMVVAALATALAPSVASALSPDLARLCRDVALKAYPYQLPGTGPGNAQNEIRA